MINHHPQQQQKLCSNPYCLRRYQQPPEDDNMTTPNKVTHTVQAQEMTFVSLSKQDVQQLMLLET